MIRIVHNAEQNNQVKGQWPKPMNRSQTAMNARNFTFGVYFNCCTTSAACSKRTCERLSGSLRPTPLKLRKSKQGSIKRESKVGESLEIGDQVFF
jgi:hypothetical protein